MNASTSFASHVALTMAVLIAAPLVHSAQPSSPQPSSPQQPMAGYDAFATREHVLGPGVGLLVAALDETASPSTEARRDNTAASSAGSPNQAHEGADRAVAVNASSNSAWLFTDDQRVCRLERGVPKFGVVRFIRVAGAAQSIELQLDDPAARGAVDVVTRKPSSLGVAAPLKRIGSIELLATASTWVRGPTVEALLVALQDGEWAGIAVPGVAEPIPLAGDNFVAAFADYRACLAHQTQADSASVIASAVIHFAVDKTSITPADVQLLQRVVAQGKEQGSSARFVVDGHTDSTGSLRHNETLARARAAAASAYLRAHGIDKARVAQRGYAYRVPVASNKTKRGRALNRRATVRLVKNAAAHEPVPTSSIKRAPANNAT